MNHVVTKITNKHLPLLRKFIKPPKPEKATDYYYYPHSDIKKRYTDGKRFTTVFSRYYYANIMEILKCETLNPDYTTNNSFVHNRPFYFLCDMLKNKKLLQGKGTHPLVRAIQSKLNYHEIKTIKEWEKKVNNVIDIFLLMFSWYVQYEIKTMTAQQLVKIHEKYEKAVKLENDFNVNDYKTTLIDDWNVALWAKDIFGNEKVRSMTDWMNIDIDELGEVKVEKEAKVDTLSIQTANTCHELAVLIGCKLAKLCKTGKENESVGEQEYTREQMINICEQNLAALVSLPGSKKIHVEGKNDKRLKKYVVDKALIKVLYGIVVNKT